MPEAQASKPFTTTFEAGVPGLATVGYQIVDEQNTVVVARTTAGVIELGSQTGIYRAQPSAPSPVSPVSWPVAYAVLWDTGQGAGSVWATDDLTVWQGPPPTPTLAAGAYTSPAAVRQALAPDGATDNSTAASLDDAAIDDAIVEAQQEIDSRLAGRYPVPFGHGAFPDVPPIIGMIARDFAAWNATLTFFRSNPVPEGHPALRRYQRAEQRLQDLVSGRAELAQTAAEEDAGMAAETPGGGADVENLYDGDMFTLDGMSLGPSQGRPGGLSMPPFGLWW